MKNILTLVAEIEKVTGKKESQISEKRSEEFNSIFNQNYHTVEVANFGFQFEVFRFGGNTWLCIRKNGAVAHEAEGTQAVEMLEKSRQQLLGACGEDVLAPLF